MFDLVVGVIALATFIVFLGITYFKMQFPDPALLVVFAVVVAMAVFDFWASLRRRRRISRSGLGR